MEALADRRQRVPAVYIAAPAALVTSSPPSVPAPVAADRSTRAAAVAGIVSFVALLWLAAPTAPARDGAELTAAAASLGVAHPTGFSLEIVAIRVLMCLPFGDLGFRANVANALFGSLALALVARFASRGDEAREGDSGLTGTVVALVAPLVLLSSKTILRGFSGVEVYASSTLISLVALASAARTESDRARAARALRTLALFAGLSFVTHTSTRSAVVAAAIAMLVRSPEVRSHVRSANVRAIGSWTLLAALGASLVGYLVVAARRAPWVDWGGPEDLRGLVAHVSAARVREAFASQMGGGAGAFFEALATMSSDLGPAVLALAAVGAVIAIAREKSVISLALVLSAVFDFLYTVLVNPMGTKDLQTLFVTEAALVILAARAISWLASKVEVATQRRWVILGVSAVVAVVSLVRADLRFSGAREGWTSVEVFGGPGAIGAAPPRAVILCESDELCGGSLFARVCEGERPDVVVLPRQHLWDRTTWRRLSVALGHAPRERFAPRSADEALRVRRLRSIVGVFGARVRWEQGERLDEQLAGIIVRPSESPVLARVEPRGVIATAAGSVVEPRESVDDVSRWLAPRESRGVLSQRIASTVLFAAGMRAASGDLSSGGAFFEAALARDATHVGALTNLAVVRAGEGRLSEAIALTERALSIDPSRAVARANLARYRAAQR